MSILTREEFAAVCKTTVPTINTNISRKKISVLTSDKKKIDTENPLNKIFKKKYIALFKKKEADEKITEIKSSGKKEDPTTFKEMLSSVTQDLGLSESEMEEIFTKEETVQNRRQRLKQNEEDEEVVDWDTRKKIADALKAERAAELAQLQVDKLMGNLMPLDLIEMILKVNIQDIFKTFENECINLGSIYCDILAGGNREKLSDLIKALRQSLSDTISRIEDTTAIEIENAIESYSEVRSRGEKK